MGRGRCNRTRRRLSPVGRGVLIGIGRKSKAEGVAFERPVKVTNNKQEIAQRTEGAPKPGNKGLGSGRETPSKRHETEGVWSIRTWWYITPVGDAPLASRLMMSSYVIWGECCPICCGWWTAQGARSVSLLQA